MTHDEVVAPFWKQNKSEKKNSLYIHTLVQDAVCVLLWLNF